MDVDWSWRRWWLRGRCNENLLWRVDDHRRRQNNWWVGEMNRRRIVDEDRKRRRCNEQRLQRGRFRLLYVYRLRFGLEGRRSSLEDRRRLLYDFWLDESRPYDIWLKERRGEFERGRLRQRKIVWIVRIEWDVVDR